MTTAASLDGIFAPVITPFRENGELDRAGFEHNIRTHMQQGLQGVVVSGSTGEAALLDERERECLVEWSRPHVPNDRLLIAGVGAESTRMTLRYADSAAERGADVGLVIAPHYFGGAMTDDALRAHFLRVADECAMPVMLYNNPKYMHFRLSQSLVAELSRHENVIGIKDSLGDKDLYVSYLATQSDSFSVLTGNGTFESAALQLGGRGGILAVALFAASMTLAIRDAVSRRDAAAADEIQARVTPLARTIVGELGPAGVKAACDYVGLRGGKPRMPLPPLGSADLDRVRQMLSEAELPVAA